MRIEKKDVPFFENVPDENLVSYIQKKRVSKGKSTGTWMWSG